MDTVIFV